MSTGGQNIFFNFYLRFQDQAADPAGFWVEFWAEYSGEVILIFITSLVTILLSDPLKILFKKVGNWFIRWFQSLGLGFEKRYIQALVREHRRLRLIGITTSRRVVSPRLKEVYVSLKVATDSSNRGSRLPWHRVFEKENKQLVILGQPGAGKSTLMDYLALVFAGHVPNDLPGRVGNPLPLFLRLREITKKEGSNSVRELLLNPDILGEARRPKGFFERKLKGGDCIVLLDGLDEVLDPRQNERVVQEIKQLVNDYPENYFVVTCRIAGWANQLPNFSVHEVQKFDPDDIRQFIGAWFREVLRSERLRENEVEESGISEEEIEKKAIVDATSLADTLWSELQKNESLLLIASTPLILSLITLVYHIDKEKLPKGRTRLYRRCLDILLEEWDWKEKKLNIPNVPTLSDKLLIMKTIGHHFLMSGVVQMDRDALEELLIPLLDRISVSQTAPQILDHIWKRSGIIQEEARDRFSFAHRALLDYLAASVIVEQNKEVMLLDHVEEEAWREVMLIAIGLLKPAKRAESLIRGLYQNTEDENRVALAGWSLAEDVQVSSEIRSGVKEKILSRIAVTESELGYQNLVSALLTAEPTAATLWIQEVLSGRDRGQQQRLLSMLPQFGDNAGQFTPVILDILQQSDSILIKREALRALASLPADPDGKCWSVLDEIRHTSSEDLKAAANWAWCMLGREEELGFVKVPAGEFIYGEGESKESHFLPDFFIAKHPVTGEQFRNFAKKNNYSPEITGSLQCPLDHPVTYVTWRDAQAYAKGNGFYLPSEQEWEKAARGTDGRDYPWGDMWEKGLANSTEYWSTKRSFWKPWRKKTGRTTPVGQFSPEGDSPYHCADMAGNVWEWTRSAYNGKPGGSSRDIPTNPVLRGGSFLNNQQLLSLLCSRPRQPLRLLDFVGFRVVVLPPPMSDDPDAKRDF